MVDVIDVTRREKMKLASYQLKDGPQVRLEQWNDEIHFMEYPIDWELFKASFHYRLFPLDWRKNNTVDYTKHRQWGMSVKDYSIKFTQH